MPTFRCTFCNVRIVVTNQSYLNPGLLDKYKYLVKTKQLSTYEDVDHVDVHQRRTDSEDRRGDS